MKIKFLFLASLFFLTACAQSGDANSNQSSISYDSSALSSESNIPKDSNTTESESTINTIETSTETYLSEQSESSSYETTENSASECSSNQENEDEAAKIEEYYVLIKTAWQKQVDYIESIEDPKVKQSVQSSLSAANFEATSLRLENPNDSGLILTALQKVVSGE